MKNLEWKKKENLAKHFDFNGVSEKAGVYIISTKQKSDNKYEVKYIGQAQNLKSRGTYHFSDNETNKQLKQHIANNYYMKFSYAEVSVQQDRDGIELFLFNKFEPIYNNNTPPASIESPCSLPDVRKKP